MLQPHLGHVKVLFATFQQEKTTVVNAIDKRQYWGILNWKIEALSCILVEFVLFIKQITDCETKFSSGHL